MAPADRDPLLTQLEYRRPTPELEPAIAALFRHLRETGEVYPGNVAALALYRLLPFRNEPEAGGSARSGRGSRPAGAR